MKIRVLFFARLRELVGSETREVDLPEGATLGEVWSRLQEETPVLRGLSNPPLMTRDLEYATPETVLTGDEEVAFFPPVSGG